MSLSWPNKPDELHPHYKIIESLVGMAAFLNDHPQLPIGRAGDANLVFMHPDWPNVTHSQQAAFVRSVAHILDVPATWEGDARLTACLTWDRGSIEAVALFGDEEIAAIQSARIVPVAAAEAMPELLPGFDFDEDDQATVTMPAVPPVAAWRPRHSLGAQAW